MIYIIKYDEGLHEKNMSIKIMVTLGLLNIQILIEVFDWFRRMSLSRYFVFLAESLWPVYFAKSYFVFIS